MNLVNSPSYPKRSNYQPGGICAGFDGIMRTRYLRQGSDPLGRWTWHEFGQNNMISRIYTYYRVNSGSEHTSGYSTTWFQQKMLLEEKGIKGNPRVHSLQDLVKEL